MNFAIQRLDRHSKDKHGFGVSTCQLLLSKRSSSQHALAARDMAQHWAGCSHCKGWCFRYPLPKWSPVCWDPRPDRGADQVGLPILTGATLHFHSSCFFCLHPV